MHETIHRALASSVERDRVTAASAARTRRSLERAKQQAERTTSGQRGQLGRLAEAAPRHSDAGR